MLKRLIKRTVRYCTDSNERFYVNSRMGFHDRMPDEKFLKKMFQARMGKPLDLEHPTTFNEKLQWLKLHDRKPEHTVMVDKYAVKEYVASRIGEEYVIPLLGVWDSVDDIPFDELPGRFVLKCTHDSRGLVICRDKSKLDIEQAKEKLKKALSYDFYSFGREWPYKNVPHRIIAEQYMEDDGGKGELTDYKIHCFGGAAKLVQVITDRFSSTGMINVHYTPEWERLDVARGHYSTSAQSVPRPAELDEMLALAEKLSAGEAYVRVDFYIVNHKVYFGELTFFPSSGFVPFVPEEWDRTFGDWIELPPVTE